MNTRLVILLALLAACFVQLAASFDDPAPSDEIETTVLYRPDKCERTVAESDTVKIHFTGLNFATEKQFDSSRGGKPIQFTVGKHLVLPAWELGVSGMCVGEIRRITSSATYAYGGEGVRGFVAPEETVIFDIELMDIVSSLLPVQISTVVLGFAIMSGVFYLVGVLDHRRKAREEKARLEKERVVMVEEVEVSEGEDPHDEDKKTG